MTQKIMTINGKRKSWLDFVADLFSGRVHLTLVTLFEKLAQVQQWRNEMTANEQKIVNAASVIAEAALAIQAGIQALKDRQTDPEDLSQEFGQLDEATASLKALADNLNAGVASNPANNPTDVQGVEHAAPPLPEGQFEELSDPETPVPTIAANEPPPPGAVLLGDDPGIPEQATTEGLETLPDPESGAPVVVDEDEDEATLDDEDDDEAEDTSGNVVGDGGPAPAGMTTPQVDPADLGSEAGTVTPIPAETSTPNADEVQDDLS